VIRRKLITSAARSPGIGH